MQRLTKIFGTIVSILMAVSSSYSQGSTIYRLKDVGFISIPANMELQSGEYRKIAQKNQIEMGKEIGYEISDNRIVFQQKGLNGLKDGSLSSYARVILETNLGRPGEYEKITTKIKVTNTDLSELNIFFKNQTEQSFANTQMRLISWYGVSIVSINGIQALKTSFLRQLGDRPYVLVTSYSFQNSDRTHTLTLAYRQSEEAIWKPLYENILNSFRITNRR